METDSLTEDATQLIASPKFDAVQFVTQVNQHFKNPKIIELLVQEPGIFLSLLHSGEYDFLIEEPSFIKESLFEKLHNVGYNVWAKIKISQWNERNVWYGVYIDELKLGFTWKRFTANRRAPKLEAYSLEGECADIEKSWRKFKMAPLGQDYVPSELPPAAVVRQKVLNALQDLGFENSYAMRTSSNNTDINCWIRKNTGNYRWQYQAKNRVSFNIYADSKTRSRVVMHLWEDDMKIDKSSKLLEPVVSSSLGSPIYYTYEFKINNDEENLVKSILGNLAQVSKNIEKVNRAYLQGKQMK